MASCIYDDSPAVGVCPGCDFGVCQSCLDQGTEGVCKTCAEERETRRSNSALNRTYETPAAPVKRCNYCRAAEDEQTSLDEEGYCEACRALPRCIAHADLVAVGHCKTCRREFCRKCLGFTDICQACQAKPKTRPLTDKAAAEAARGGKPAKKARQTAPMDGGGTKGGKPKPRAPKGKDGGEATAPKRRTRGQSAIEEKLRAQNANRPKTRLIVFASVLALGLLLLVSGTYMHAMSPDAQAAKLREQMFVVHRAVVLHYKKTDRFPSSPAEISATLETMNVKGARRIRISSSHTRAPNTIIYAQNRNGAGFTIQGADNRGELLLDPNQMPYMLDEYSDTGNGPAK